MFKFFYLAFFTSLRTPPCLAYVLPFQFPLKCLLCFFYHFHTLLSVSSPCGCLPFKRHFCFKEKYIITSYPELSSNGADTDKFCSYSTCQSAFTEFLRDWKNIPSSHSAFCPSDACFSTN